MAAFASDRRSGCVRVLVLILCALFIFATVATPPAYAAGETVALFGLAAVLSAATAALGFKLANNAEGQATLQKMVQDFAGASIAAGLVLTGSKVNGLINGMQYIKMAVHNGKTYLDERVAAWCQQWLADHGVYNTSGVSYPSQAWASSYSYRSTSFDSMLSILSSSGVDISVFQSILSHFSIIQDKDKVYQFSIDYLRDNFSDITAYHVYMYDYLSSSDKFYFYSFGPDISGQPVTSVANTSSSSSGQNRNATDYYYKDGSFGQKTSTPFYIFLSFAFNNRNISNTAGISSLTGATVSLNDSGLSGTDTLGKDYVNKTLEQVLAGLKEWAQDWFDAGADSVTNSQAGAKDLPLSVATGAATLNPDVAEDSPLVYFPAFGWSLPKLRSGETDTKTVDQGKENASAAETSVDVAENQTVIDSLVNWALGYISPDTGLFSKFPLCVPYDAYLLACSALGVGVVGSDSIFGASPDDLSSIVQTGDEQSEGFTPVITISNDLTLDGYTYPLDLTIDLTDWTPLIKFVRLCISLTVIAELVGAEYKRIKGK